MIAQVTKEKNSYREAFDALTEEMNGRQEPWAARLRESAMEGFEQLGFPSVDEEEWKYTNLAPLAKKKFAPVIDAEAGDDFDERRLEAFAYAEASRSQLVFVNGIYRPRLSSLEALPEGVVAINLADALEGGEYASVVREHLARAVETVENGLTALNTAFLRHGALLLIPKGVRLAAPLHLLFLSSTQIAETVSFPRVLIVAEQAAEATVIESYAGTVEGAYWTNAVTEVVLAEGAKLEHYKVQRESTQAFHTATTRAVLARSSVFNTNTINFGAKLSRHNISVALNAEGAECRVDGLYIVGTGQHADTHSLINHLRPHCTSRQLYKGILDGKSRAVFNGKVFVHKDAQQTDAQQTNRNLLLSNEARVDTKPQLEIFADDVKCAHGATVGQLEEEELFYLISRGLSPDIARNLLTYGFAEEVISTIKIESIKAQLDEIVLNRLHAKL
jgi:Fe-S cluster assembly protein SufD